MRLENRLRSLNARRNVGRQQRESTHRSLNGAAQTVVEAHGIPTGRRIRLDRRPCLGIGDFSVEAAWTKTFLLSGSASRRPSCNASIMGAVRGLPLVASTPTASSVSGE